MPILKFCGPQFLNVKLKEVDLYLPQGTVHLSYLSIVRNTFGLRSAVYGTVFPTVAAKIRMVFEEWLAHLLSNDKLWQTGHLFYKHINITTSVMSLGLNETVERRCVTSWECSFNFPIKCFTCFTRR